MQNIVKHSLSVASIIAASALCITPAYAIVSKVDCNSSMAKSTLFNNSTTYDPVKAPKGKTFTDNLGINWKVTNSIAKGTVTSTTLGASPTSVYALRCTYVVGQASLYVESTNIKAYNIQFCSGGVCSSVYYEILK